MTDLRSLNLNAVQAFELVAEHGSFRKAADESTRSQSALSTQIKELEAQLGMKLFDRSTRRVTLTAEGREFLEHIRRAFLEISSGLTNARTISDQRSERVSFACIPAVSMGIAPWVLKTFEKDHPDVVATFVELYNEDLIRAVRNQEVEFAIGASVPASDCDFEPICTDEAFALFPTENGSYAKDEITMAELIDYPILLTRPAQTGLPMLEREARIQKKSLNLRHHLRQPATVANMVAAGHGIGVIGGLFSVYSGIKNVRVVRIVDPEISRDISIIVRRGSQLSKHAQILIRLLKTALLEKFAKAGIPAGIRE